MRFIGIFPEVPEVGIRGQRSAPQDFPGCPSSLEMSGFLPPRLTTVRANLDVMVTCLAVVLLFSKRVLATHSVCLYTAPEPTPVSDLVSRNARLLDYHLPASDSSSSTEMNLNSILADTSCDVEALSVTSAQPRADFWCD